MTTRRKPHIERMEPVLAQAHRRRQTVAVGEDWTRDVMHTIRREAAAGPSASMLAWMEPLVWRAAAWAALMAVVLTGSVVAYTSRQPDPAAAAWLDEFDAGPPLFAE
ncbi:MAG: hypothetical protein H0V35_02125 [Nitrospira sp.]|nr:hypothetical protein [Nitrospira sp.]